MVCLDVLGYGSVKGIPVRPLPLIITEMIRILVEVEVRIKVVSLLTEVGSASGAVDGI